MISIGCCIPGGSLMPEGVREVPDSPVTQIVEKCRYLLSLGYDCTECAGGMLTALTPEEEDALIRENRKSSLCLRAVNSLFPWNWHLADPDADREPYLAHARRLFSLMGRLKIPYAVFGSGAARSLVPEKENSRATLWSFIEDIAKIAKENGVTLLIEPLRRTESNVFTTVPGTAEELRTRNPDNVRLLMDAFHMAEEGTDPALAEDCADLTLHCHVAESPKRTAPGTADSADPTYLPRFADALKRGHYAGTVSVECGFSDFCREAKETLAYLRRFFPLTAVITPERDMIEEPIRIPVRQGIPADTQSAVAGEHRFPASPVEGGALVILTAKKGERLELTFENTPVPGAPHIDWDEGAGIADLCHGEHRFAQYVARQQAKPYLGPVTDDAGIAFTRLDFETREHPHQRSVFVAVGDVNGVDCWNETPNHGYVRNESVSEIVSGAAYAAFTAKNRWEAHDGTPLMTETTRYTIYNQSDACRALDLAITFTADYGEVVFGATKEAGPLGIRVRDELRGDVGGRLRNSWGAVGEPECWGRSAVWCDYCGEPDGIGPMGITVFDCEKNERFPTAWHIRSYGLFAVNNLYFKGGLTIPAGESLTYRFRVLFRRRPMAWQELSDRYVLYMLHPIE